MRSKESLINIIQDVVVNINCLVEIRTITSSGSDYLLKVCDVKWAQAGYTLTIGSQPYKILSVDWVKKELLVTPDGHAIAITAKQFLLYRPFFFHGTPIDTGTDLAKQANLSKKTPMIWLLETFEEEFNENNDEEEERRSPVRLFFLTQADLKKRPEQLQKEYVECMTRLKDAFIEAIEANHSRFDTNDLHYNTKYYPKFGVYITEKGVEKKYWADDLSGCEIDPQLLILKVDSCCRGKDRFYFSDEEETYIFTDENGVPFTSEL